MGLMKYVIELVNDAKDVRTADWGRRWRVTGKWFKLRCNCVLVQHTWYIEYVFNFGGIEPHVRLVWL